MVCSSPSSTFLLLIIVAGAVFSGNLMLVSAQTGCPVSLSFNGTDKTYSQCTDLQNQGSTLSWSFSQDSSNSEGILDVAFRTTLPQSSGWAGWGINLESATDMIGTNTLIAFVAANGSNVLPYKVTQAQKSSSLAPLVVSPLDIPVISKSVQIVDLSVIIFATIRLPSNLTVINQFWNTGNEVTNFQPATHSFQGEHVTSFSSLDLSTGAASAGADDNTNKNIHGILNVVSWGLLLPLGIICARYVRQFSSSAWFYIHVCLQLAAFIIGVAGFGTGLAMGGGPDADMHRALGITIFTLATLQITALVLRPKPDHKLRCYWNVYHHGFGYVIIVLAIINITEGLDLLQPETKYRTAYTGAICGLAAIAVVLEVITWALWYRKRSKAAAGLQFELKTTDGQRNGDSFSASQDGRV